MPPTETAYRVPFHIDRRFAPKRYELRNDSDEPVDGLTLTHLGTGYCPPLRVRSLAPGVGLTIALFGADPESAGVIVVRWRRQGLEYVWRMSL